MTKPCNHSHLRLYRPHPCLTFAPLAWLKLQYFCHLGLNEVGGFGIAAEDDPLCVEDFVTVCQEVTPTSVRFDDNAVADFFDGCVDRGLPVERFGRLWCHTHPWASVTPSKMDEKTFAGCFGRCNWSVMFILGRTGLTYARLAFRVGPGAQIELPVTVDWSAWPDCLVMSPGRLEAQIGQWHQEFVAHIHPLSPDRHPYAWVALDEPGSVWWQQCPWDPELDDVCYEPLPERKPDESTPCKPAS
jgi:hypothetical protein